MKYYIVPILFALCLLSAASCKKEAEPEPEPPVHVPDFIVTGEQYIHQPVKFRSNFNRDVQLTWYYGNFAEQTVLGTESSYVFTSTGTFNVTMAVVDSSTAGGTATKSVTITNGLDRIDGEQQWNFLVNKEKAGSPPGTIPPSSFSRKLTMNIISDTSILIPDIPELPYRGPYKVNLVYVTPKEMLLKSTDGRNEVSLAFGTSTGGLKLTQVSGGIAWHLHGYATIR